MFAKCMGCQWSEASCQQSEYRLAAPAVRIQRITPEGPPFDAAGPHHLQPHVQYAVAKRQLWRLAQQAILATVHLRHIGCRVDATIPILQ